MIKKIFACAAMLAPLAAVQADPGLNGSYWAGGYYGGTGGTPTATFLTNTVCFPTCNGAVSSGDGDYLSNFLGVPSGYTTGLSTDFQGLANHALTLSGFLNIAAAGSYSFGLSSDDGSYLWIDGNLVVWNGGDHAMQYASGNATLSAGQHSILIYQEENGGGTGLVAFVNGDALGGSWLSTELNGGVPEPASWAMMVGGFGLVGGAMRRRRTSLRFA
jgi:hypothetical protein